MAKRPRGKTAEKLKKRAKARTTLEESLLGSSWQTLNPDQEASLDLNEEEKENEYERRPRKFTHLEEESIERLPIKQGSSIKRVMDRRIKKEDESSEDEEANEDHDSDNADEEESNSEEIEDDSNDKDIQGNYLSDKQIVLNTKEFIADCAEKLNEDSEENIAKLRELRQYYFKTKCVNAKRILLLSMIPIFRSLIPGYRIRELTESEKSQKLSKDVKKLRNFEETLVANYRAYIDILKNVCKRARKEEDQNSAKAVLGQTAVKSACELLESVSYFNFRNDLIEIIVTRLSSRRIDEAFNRCIITIEKVFDFDEEGQVSFDIVRILTRMIKARHYKIEESILNCFLHLRLLTELSAKADLQKVDHLGDSGDMPKKIRKKDRVHLTKKQRKERRENKMIELELQRAETSVSSEERERLQGETLKLVFILYFNILKERVSNLIGVTLEGLAKFAHLINADLFGDILEVVRELIQQRQQIVNSDGSYYFNEATTRESLLCIATAFALLSGQAGESMNLDLSFFTSHFYSALYSIALNPDIEFSHKTLRLDDPLENHHVPSIRNRVNMSTETELIVRICEAIFFRQRASGRIRIQAFAKRLMISSLQMPEKSCIATLMTLDKMLKKYSVVASLFSSEDRISNGIYHMDVDDPDHSNPEAATIWETVLLEKHYSPAVAKAAGMVASLGQRELKRK